MEYVRLCRERAERRVAGSAVAIAATLAARSACGSTPILVHHSGGSDFGISTPMQTSNSSSSVTNPQNRQMVIKLSFARL
jgi:hypothetical protein